MMWLNRVPDPAGPALEQAIPLVLIYVASRTCFLSIPQKCLETVQEEPPAPLIIRSTSNPLKLKINSKALTQAEERKSKKSHGKVTNNNSTMR